MNLASKLDFYPIPMIKDLLAQLAGGKLFTKLDMSQAYQQLLLDEDSKKFVVINTHQGLYQFNWLTFGVASAPGIFQRVIKSLLSGIPRVVVYIDDILVTGKTQEAHLAALEEVLKRLGNAGLRLKKEKCVFITVSGLLGLLHRCPRHTSNGGEGEGYSRSPAAKKCVRVKVLPWSNHVLFSISRH